MTRFQPSHMSVLNSDAPTRQLARRNGGEIEAVASSQVRTSSDMVTFVDRVENAVSDEIGESFLSTPAALSSIQATAKSSSDVKVIAPLFGQLRSFAQGQGASKTDQAILKAAAWYYNNVEKPKSGTSGGSSYKPAATGTGSSSSGAGAATAEPFYKKTWFRVAAPLTLAAVVGGLIIFWPQDEARPAASTPKRKLSMKQAKGKRVEPKPSPTERARRQEADEFLGSSDDTGLLDGMYGEDGFTGDEYDDNTD
jgi:hypothetical protein